MTNLQSFIKGNLTLESLKNKQIEINRSCFFFFFFFSLNFFDLLKREEEKIEFGVSFRFFFSSFNPVICSCKLYWVTVKCKKKSNFNFYLEFVYMFSSSATNKKKVCYFLNIENKNQFGVFSCMPLSFSLTLSELSPP